MKLLKIIKFGLLISTLAGVLGSIQIAEASQPLKSEKIRNMVCQSLAAKYKEQGDAGAWERWLWEKEGFDGEYSFEGLYVAVDEKKCNQSKDLVVTKVNTKKLGNKEFVKSLELSFEQDEVQCKGEVTRDHEVILKDDGTYEIKLKGWLVSYEPECRLTYPKTLAAATLDSKNVKLVKSEDLNVELLIPEYLTLGEPDDSASTGDYRYFKVMYHKKVVGYMATFIYHNSEGEWANRYVFKYTKSGKFIASLMQKIDMDYEEAVRIANPEQVQFPEEFLAYVYETLDTVVGYVDEDDRFWSIHDVYGYEVLKLTEMQNGDLFYEVSFVLGMGHEYDESVVFNNDTCVVKVLYSHEKEKYSLEDFKCEVVKAKDWE